MHRISLKPKTEAQAPLRLEPSHEIDLEPRDLTVWDGEAHLMHQGARVVNELTETIRRAIPGVTKDQARDAAFAVIERAARRSNGRPLPP